ncbi:MAG: DNA-binding transcriptional LysR family regulator [Flavobacteriales bacterium]|jgi:DNA-binding transcriptional LysR family regulator
MTLDQLRMLNALAEGGSLKAASELLHKTQPALSQGLKQLENQLGFKLLCRKGYKLELTPEGRIVLDKSQKILRHTEELKQLSRTIGGGNEAKITIILETSFHLDALIPVLKLVQSEFPNTQLDIRQENLTGAIDKIKLGQCDLAITPLSDDNRMRLSGKQEYLKSVILQTVVSPQLFSRLPLKPILEDLIDEYQIVLSDTGKGTEGVNLGVQDGQRRWYVTELQAKKNLICTGLGWGKLPDYLIKAELKQSSLIPLKADGLTESVTLDYYVIEPEHYARGPVAQFIWTEIARTFLTA